MLSPTRARVHLATSLALAALAAGCGDDATGGTVDAAVDGATVAPLVAPDEQWTWVQVDGMKCGNGSPTGVAVNLSSRSRDVVVFLNGGGACWDAQTCFVLRTAAGIDTDFGAAQFQQVASSVAASPLFQRAATAPFPDASYVFVPYCTGDVHAGHRVATYSTGGGPRDVHHVGQDNLDALWPRLIATRPDADALWVTGASAGGYGAMIQGPRARVAWPTALVHILSDSSHPVDPEPSRWAAMRAAWSVDIPADCADCARGLGAYPAHIRATAPAGSRWGLLMATRDQVIAGYMGFSAPALETATLAIRDAMAPGTNQGAFVINGTAHVLTSTSPLATTSSGTALSTWLRALATGAPGWQSVGP